LHRPDVVVSGTMAAPATTLACTGWPRSCLGCAPTAAPSV
jgi:hypothetical protein